MLPGSASTGEATTSAKAATLNTASNGRPVTRLTTTRSRRACALGGGHATDPERVDPVPGRRTTPGVTSTAATMLRIVTTRRRSPPTA